MPTPRRIEIATADGVCEAWLHGGGDGPRPAVLLYDYCMGERLAFLTAAQHPETVRAAASFHGGHLVTDDPGSPHRLAARLRAAVYLGVAADDRTCTPEHQGALATALAAADVAYCIELYRGKQHGFAVSDHPVYDREAAERHWRRLEAFLGETLG